MAQWLKMFASTKMSLINLSLIPGTCHMVEGENRLAKVILWLLHVVVVGVYAFNPGTQEAKVGGFFHVEQSSSATEALCKRKSISENICENKDSADGIFKNNLSSGSGGAHL